MPIYEYQCGSCGHEFEEMQKINDAPVKICESCGAKKVKRLISQTSFHLKGGGWYSDLYGSSSSASKKSVGKTSAKTSSSSGSSSSSTKSSSSKSSSSSSSSKSKKK